MCAAGEIFNNFNLIKLIIFELGLTALLKKMDYKDVKIAVDGSLFRHHPHLHNVMKSRITQMMGVD